MSCVSLFTHILAIKVSAYRRLWTIIFQWRYHQLQSRVLAQCPEVDFWNFFPLWATASILGGDFKSWTVARQQKDLNKFPFLNLLISLEFASQRIDNFHKKIRRSYDGEILKKNWLFVCVKKVWDLLNKYIQKIYSNL